jgi:uncharacterized protein YecE (DUF72 family)
MGTKLEDRVAALEAELQQLKKHVYAAANKDWWAKIWGVFANDPAFEEATRLGRAWRESCRAKPRRRKVSSASKRRKVSA